MHHVIEVSTGNIVENCHEGADLSRYNPALFEVISGAPNLAGLDELRRHRYQAGEMLAKPVVTLTADKLAITADGQDQAAVSVAVAGADPLPASIDIEVGGLVETVALAGGAGQLPPITAETAGDIEVRASDLAAYFDQGGITIRAEE